MDSARRTLSEGGGEGGAFEALDGSGLAMEFHKAATGDVLLHGEDDLTGVPEKSGNTAPEGRKVQRSCRPRIMSALMAAKRSLFAGRAGV